MVEANDVEAHVINGEIHRTRRGLFYVTLGAIATAACGPEAKPEPNPTATLEPLPDRRPRIYPTATAVNPDDANFFRVLIEKWWIHNNWYQDFTPSGGANPKSLWYPGKPNDKEDYSPMGFLDIAMWRRLGIVTDFRGKQEENARRYVREYKIEGRCAETALAGGSFKYPLTHDYDRYQELPISFNTRVGLLVALIEPIVARRLVEHVHGVKNSHDSGTLEWYEEWRKAKFYEREPYLIMMKRNSKNELWFRLGIGYSRQKQGDGLYHIELANPDDPVNPFVVPYTEVDKVLMMINGTEKDRLRSIDLDLDQEPYKSVIMEAVYGSSPRMKMLNFLEFVMGREKGKEVFKDLYLAA